MNVCFIGDSIVLGIGAPACLGWPGRVCAWACSAGSELTCHNLGVRGSTSLDIRDHWAPEAARRLPAEIPGLLILSFGAADANQGVPLEESLAAAETLLTEAGGKYPLLMAGPTPVKDPEVRERVEALNQAFKEISAKAGVPYLDLFTPLAESPGYSRDLELGDGVHPGAEGYDEITRLVFNWEEFQKRLPGAETA